MRPPMPQVVSPVLIWLLYICTYVHMCGSHLSVAATPALTGIMSTLCIARHLCDASTLGNSQLVGSRKWPLSPPHSYIICSVIFVLCNDGLFNDVSLTYSSTACTISDVSLTCVSSWSLLLTASSSDSYTFNIGIIVELAAFNLVLPLNSFLLNTIF